MFVYTFAMKDILLNKKLKEKPSSAFQYVWNAFPNMEIIVTALCNEQPYIKNISGIYIIHKKCVTVMNST